MISIYRFKNGNVDEFTTIKYMIYANGDTPTTAVEIKEILDLKLNYSIKLTRIHHLLSKLMYYGYVVRVGRGQYIKSQETIHINVEKEFPFMLDPEWMIDAIQWDIERHFIEYIQSGLHTNKCIKIYGWKNAYPDNVYTKDVAVYKHMDVHYKVLYAS